MTHLGNKSVLNIGFEPMTTIPSGVRRYSRELIRALKSSAAERNSSLIESAVSKSLHAVTARAWAAGFGGNFAHIPAGATLHATSLLAPPRTRFPLAVTIHDLVAFTHPETLTKHGARWHQRMTLNAVSSSDAVVVPTEAISRQLIDLFANRAPGLADRVHVVGGAPTLLTDTEHGSTLDESHDAANSRPYLIFVGTVEPRKGLDMLLPAMTTHADLDLVIVGAAGWGSLNLRHMIRAVNGPLGWSPDRIRITGPLADDELARLMQGAEALVLPSRAEGFGLPILEAMSLGTPVIHSSDPALVEVAGGAAVSFMLHEDNRDSTSALSDAITQALENREALVAGGRIRSRQFSWEASAQRVWDIHTSLRNSSR